MMRLAESRWAGLFQAAWRIMTRVPIAVLKQPSSRSTTSVGGGLEVLGGSVSLTSVILNANQAQGGQGGAGANDIFGPLPGPGGPGGNGSGGGLYASGGTIALFNDSVTGNAANGGQGGLGGAYRIPPGNAPDGSAGQGQGGGERVQHEA